MRGIGIAFGVIAVLALPAPGTATTWNVPGLCPTIQAGMECASAGDTVLVACGTYNDCTHYTADGKLTCVILKSGVVLVSDTGEPDCAVIDAQLQGRCIDARSVVDAVVEGFTITGGYVEGYPGGHGAGAYISESSVIFRNCSFEGNWARHWGGGAHCYGMPAPRFEDCTFLDNTSEDDGGGMVCWFSDVNILRCTFLDNWAADHGGAMICNQSGMSMFDCVLANNTAGHYSGAITFWGECTPVVARCTIVGNRGGYSGGAIGCFLNCDPKIEYTIIAFSLVGEAVYCHDYDSEPLLSCCDLYGNAGGNWVGCIAGQNGTNGNFTQYPAFCDWVGGDYTLYDCSPCLHGHGCGQIGALGMGCAGPTVREETSWSSLKAMYR